MNPFKMYVPLGGTTLTQPFGANVDFYKSLNIGLDKGHNGLDFLAPHGVPVYAAHDGVVDYAGRDNNEGYGVVLLTEEPFDYNGQAVYYKTIYWHFTGNIPVRAGQSVKAGDLIGYADNTGLSTGSHLHFGLKPLRRGQRDNEWYNIEQNNGYFGAIDPLPYLQPFSVLYHKEVEDTKKVIESLQDLIVRYPLLTKFIAYVLKMYLDRLESYRLF